MKNSVTENTRMPSDTSVVGQYSYLRVRKNCHSMWIDRNSFIFSTWKRSAEIRESQTDRAAVFCTASSFLRISRQSDCPEQSAGSVKHLSDEEL